MLEGELSEASAFNAMLDALEHCSNILCSCAALSSDPEELISLLHDNIAKVIS